MEDGQILVRVQQQGMGDVVLLLIGFVLGGMLSRPANRTPDTMNNMPRLTGYTFDGSATFSCKDPKGVPVLVSYEKQPVGWLVFIKPDKPDAAEPNTRPAKDEPAPSVASHR